MDQRALQAEQVGEAHEDHTPDQEHGSEDGWQARVCLQEAFLSGIRQFVDPLQFVVVDQLLEVGGRL